MALGEWGIRRGVCRANFLLAQLARMSRDVFNVVGDDPTGYKGRRRAAEQTSVCTAKGRGAMPVPLYLDAGTGVAGEDVHDSGQGDRMSGSHRTAANARCNAALAPFLFQIGRAHV